MSLHVVPILEKVAGETTIGPSPTFSKLHAYKAIALLGERSLGRNALSQELGIGPGAIRTLIAKLKTADIIKIESNGCRLTKKGQNVREESREFFHICGHFFSSADTAGYCLKFFSINKIRSGLGSDCKSSNNSDVALKK